MLDFPANPPVNTVFTGGGASWLYDGIKWMPITGGGSGGSASITVGATPPANPSNGNEWWDTVSGQLFVYIDDGTSKQWVVAVNQLTGGMADAPNDAYAYARRAAAWTQVATLPAVADNVGRNVIQNPYFNVAQRGSGNWTVSGAYTMDRWVMGFYGTGASMSVTQNVATDANRSQIGDESCTNVAGIQFTGTSGASDHAYFSERIEGVRRLAGKTVTVSFWAIASSAGLKLGVSLDQSFGTGGSPSSSVLGSGQAVTMTTAFARYSLTLSLPSAAGMTLGTNANDYTNFNFWPTAGSALATRAGNVGVQSGAINLWGVQIEVGNVMTPLEKIDPMTDLQRCQRFYQVGAIYLAGYHVAGQGPASRMLFPVPMRAAPTVGLYNIAYTNGSALATAALDANGIGYWFTFTATGGGQVTSGYTASADL
jgi:hypothetical protein